MGFKAGDRVRLSREYFTLNTGTEGVVRRLAAQFVVVDFPSHENLYMHPHELELVNEKFKIGDRVRRVRYRSGWTPAVKLGYELTVIRVGTNTHGLYLVGKGNDGVERSFYAVDAEVVQRGPKFKVGDRVRKVRQGRTSERVGTEFVIAKIDHINAGKYAVGSGGWSAPGGSGVYLDELELVKPAPSKPVVPPKPFNLSATKAIEIASSVYAVSNGYSSVRDMLAEAARRGYKEGLK